MHNCGVHQTRPELLFHLANYSAENSRESSTLPAIMHSEFLCWNKSKPDALLHHAKLHSAVVHIPNYVSQVTTRMINAVNISTYTTIRLLALFEGKYVWPHEQWTESDPQRKITANRARSWKTDNTGRRLAFLSKHNGRWNLECAWSKNGAVISYSTANP